MTHFAVGVTGSDFCESLTEFHVSSSSVRLTPFSVPLTVPEFCVTAPEVEVTQKSRSVTQNPGRVTHFEVCVTHFAECVTYFTVSASCSTSGLGLWWIPKDAISPLLTAGYRSVSFPTHLGWPLAWGSSGSKQGLAEQRR
jgi:hypothetical protein